MGGNGRRCDNLLVFKSFAVFVFVCLASAAFVYCATQAGPVEVGAAAVDEAHGCHGAT